MANLQVLRALKTKLGAGMLKSDLIALIAIDPQYPADALDLKLMQHELRLTTSVVEVQHNEREACLKSTNRDLRKFPFLCKRAIGHFWLLQVPIARVNITELEAAYCRWVSRKESFCANRISVPGVHQHRACGQRKSQRACST